MVYVVVEAELGGDDMTDETGCGGGGGGGGGGDDRIEAGGDDAN